MGTPDFAVPALKKLHEAIRVSCVFSRPPAPSGRGKKLRYSQVHQTAMQLGIPCETPETLRDPLAVYRLKQLRPDVIIVAAYGLILPRAVLDIAPCLNIHASLLPRWRGAAPIQRAILAGDTESGVTIMCMDEGLDTGPMLMKRAVALTEQMNAGDVHDALAALGAEMICEAALNYASLAAEEQHTAEATYAAKITKEDAKLDFSENGAAILRRIRAMAPVPGARFSVNGQVIKLHKARFSPFMAGEYAPPGTVTDTRLRIACADGLIIPDTLQREGRSIMPADAFLRGFSVEKGDKAA